jgi:hypothetical protein
MEARRARALLRQAAAHHTDELIRLVKGTRSRSAELARLLPNSGGIATSAATF